MKKLFLTAALATLAAPAFAEPSCNPGTDLKPVWESMKTFEEEGGKVLAFKINSGGCYEIYGSQNDTKMEVFFDPNTGAEIERINA
tara:strand:+ start:1353 stop:1610 length:258 start_codon:yes stop_codon:yes gene_type:complete